MAEIGCTDWWIISIIGVKLIAIFIWFDVYCMGSKKAKWGVALILHFKRHGASGALVVHPKSGSSFATGCRPVAG